MRRRLVLQAMTAGTAAAAVGCATTDAPAAAKVVVIGGGFGGATAAKYIRLFSDRAVDIVLVEPLPEFVSCPLSNLVVGGSRQLGEMTHSLDGLTRRHGVTVLRDSANAIDTARRTVTLASGSVLAYDKLVVSPGVDLMPEQVEGLGWAYATGAVVHAWKAGSDTLALRRQLEAMPDGGVFAITVPPQPYRCPPGPYERACQVAWYFQQAKPRSKVLVLDANEDVTSKSALFKRVWAEQYPGIVEYRPQHRVLAVERGGRRLKVELQDDVAADVLNVLPPMRAARIAQESGLSDRIDNRWCGVDFLTFESTAAPHVHVLGDAIQAANGMPKSGHMANAHAKVAAAAIVARLTGAQVPPAPMLTNTCYSFVDDRQVIHVASVHEYVAAEKTYRLVPGAGGVSRAASAAEGVLAWNWAHNIWADALA